MVVFLAAMLFNVLVRPITERMHSVKSQESYHDL